MLSWPPCPSLVFTLHTSGQPGLGFAVGARVGARLAAAAAADGASSLPGSSRGLTGGPPAAKARGIVRDVSGCVPGLQPSGTIILYSLVCNQVLFMFASACHRQRKHLGQHLGIAGLYIQDGTHTNYGVVTYVV